MIKVGLTGTIASGKSEVAKILKRDGLAIFNSDTYAKKAYKKNSGIYDEIIALLSEDILVDNKVSYERISKQIFNDENKRKKLNDIIHPFVKEGIKEFFLKHKDEDIVVAEVPLLFEAKYEDLFDKIIVVSCEKDIAIERMMKYRGYSRSQALSRYNAQINPDIQISKGDFVIYNDTTIDELENSVRRVIEDIKSGNKG